MGGFRNVVLANGEQPGTANYLDNAEDLKLGLNDSLCKITNLNPAIRNNLLLEKLRNKLLRLNEEVAYECEGLPAPAAGAVTLVAAAQAAQAVVPNPAVPLNAAAVAAAPHAAIVQAVQAAVGGGDAAAARIAAAAIGGVGANIGPW